jgi:nitroreductase
MSLAERISPESLLSLFRDRRSIRRYRPDPVPDEMVQEILEAGRWAPSAGNLQPWTFIVIRDRLMREQIAVYADYAGSHRTHVAEASLLIVLCGIVAEEPEPPPRKLLDEIVCYKVYGRQPGDGDVIPGIPEAVPPGPGERLLNWLRRILGPPL